MFTHDEVIFFNDSLFEPAEYVNRPATNQEHHISEQSFNHDILVIPPDRPVYRPKTSAYVSKIKAVSPDYRKICRPKRTDVLRLASANLEGIVADTLKENKSFKSDPMVQPATFKPFETINRRASISQSKSNLLDGYSATRNFNEDQDFGDLHSLHAKLATDKSDLEHFLFLNRKKSIDIEPKPTIAVVNATIEGVSRNKIVEFPEIDQKPKIKVRTELSSSKRRRKYGPQIKLTAFELDWIERHQYLVKTNFEDPSKSEIEELIQFLNLKQRSNLKAVSGLMHRFQAQQEQRYHHYKAVNASDFRLRTENFIEHDLERIQIEQSRNIKTPKESSRKPSSSARSLPYLVHHSRQASSCYTRLGTPQTITAHELDEHFMHCGLKSEKSYCTCDVPFGQVALGFQISNASVADFRGDAMLSEENQVEEVELPPKNPPSTDKRLSIAMKTTLENILVSQKNSEQDQEEQKVGDSSAIEPWKETTSVSLAEPYNNASTFRDRVLSMASPSTVSFTLDQLVGDGGLRFDVAAVDPKTAVAYSLCLKFRDAITRIQTAWKRALNKRRNELRKKAVDFLASWFKSMRLNTEQITDTDQLEVEFNRLLNLAQKRSSSIEKIHPRIPFRNAIERQKKKMPSFVKRCPMMQDFTKICSKLLDSYTFSDGEIVIKQVKKEKTKKSKVKAKPNTAKSKGKGKKNTKSSGMPVSTLIQQEGIPEVLTIAWIVENVKG